MTTPATHTVTFKVNDQSVTIQGPRVTGQEIKRAAIAQGVPIQPSFVLLAKVGPHNTKTVGDSEVVTVNPQSEFMAIANDDNS